MDVTLYMGALILVIMQSKLQVASSSCPNFSNHYFNLKFSSPSKLAGSCPMAEVNSEEDCLTYFCHTIQSQRSCHGNAVQFTSEGNSTGKCFIVQLNGCNPPAQCDFKEDNNSKIHVIAHSTNEGSCLPEHQCADGECSRNLVRCDQKRDCSDGSDEVNCEDTVPCSSSDVFRCKGISSSKVCIPQSMVCDGKISCPDGSDEMGCSEYLKRRSTSTTMMITAISVGVVLSLLLIVLIFACGQKLYTSHYRRRERLRNLRLGSSGADYVVRLLPGEAPFQDTLPPSYSDSIIQPREEPPGYRSSNPLERLLDIAESSGYRSPHAAKHRSHSALMVMVEQDDEDSDSEEGPGPATPPENKVMTSRGEVKTTEMEVT